MTDLTRRTLFAAAGLAAAGTAAAEAAPARPLADPEALARDEAHWARVADLYDRPTGFIQLENGQFGVMAKIVRAAYEAKTLRVNRDSTLYTRGAVNDDMAAVRQRVANLLGVEPDEIVFSRGATEALQALIGGYNKLKPGDAVLYADLDYDSMQTNFEWLAHRRGVRVVKIALPEPATRDNLIAAYDAALKANPDVRLMLLTHLSHRTGLIPPVRAIADLARGRGVDVILDGGHALGQTEFRLRDLGVPFAGLNLHKWIGAPLGVGVAYIAKDRIADIDGSMSEPASPRIDARVHTGTLNYAAVLTVPDAIDFQDALGLANKAARVRFLRDRWAEALRDHPGIDILTPNDPAMHAGITSFRLRGRGAPEQAIAVRKALYDRFKIFTVERLGVAKGACVRVSPAFVNSAADMDALVRALRVLAA